MTVGQYLWPVRSDSPAPRLRAGYALLRSRIVERRGTCKKNAGDFARGFVRRQEVYVDTNLFAAQQCSR